MSAVTASSWHSPLSVAGLCIVLCLVAAPAFAQHDHSKMHAPAPIVPVEKPKEKKPAAKPPVAKPVIKQPATDPHAGHVMPVPAADPHAGHVMPVPAADPHAGHAMPAPVDHAAMGHGKPSSPEHPREAIPTVTDADRRAAFPDLVGHHAHDEQLHTYWLLDRFEGWSSDDGGAIGWEATGWIGTDTERLWLRSEGEHVDGSLENADMEVLYGRSVSRWWDVVAGLRHDFGDGPSQTFAAIGVMGLAPMKFEVQATVYVGQSGQTAARLEAEYDTLLSNRLILQWRIEAELHGKDDPLRDIGSGLGTTEAGLRLRYEKTRQFAPYIGVVREHAYGDTANYRRARGEQLDDTRLVAGLRIWF